MVDILIWLSQYGGWGLLLIVIIFIIVFYDELEKLIAKLYDLFSWVSAGWRRKAVKAGIESNVNSFSRSIDKEAPKYNALQHEITVCTRDGQGRAAAREESSASPNP